MESKLEDVAKYFFIEEIKLKCHPGSLNTEAFDIANNFCKETKAKVSFIHNRIKTTISHEGKNG